MHMMVGKGKQKGKHPELIWIWDARIWIDHWMIQTLVQNRAKACALMKTRTCLTGWCCFCGLHQRFLDPRACIFFGGTNWLHRKSCNVMQCDATWGCKCMCCADCISHGDTSATLLVVLEGMWKQNIVGLTNNPWESTNTTQAVNYRT